MSEWFEIPGLEPTFIVDSTFARCFDVKGKEFAIVGVQSGLVFLIKQEGEKTFFAVDPKCLPACQYLFQGGIQLKDFIEGKRETLSVHSEGGSDGVGYDPLLVGSNPWDMPDSVELYVPYDEWVQRLDLCRGCKLYNHKNGVCKKDGLFVASRATRGISECPIGVWGVSATFDADEYTRRQAAAGGGVSLEDQSDFEAEWDARNVGS